MKKKWLFIFIISFVIFFLLEDAILLYNKLNKDHPILGQKLNWVTVSGLKRDQAMVLSSKFNDNTPLKLSASARIIEVQKKDIGTRINYQATMDQLYATGRMSNLFQNILTQNKALFGLSNTKLVFTISKPLLVLKVLAIETDINTKPQPQMPDFLGNISNTIPQKNGIKVISSKLSQIIINNIFNPPLKPITVPTQIIIKKYDSYDMDKIRKQAAEYTREPLSITSGGIVLTLSSKDLQSLLTVAEQPDPIHPQKTIMILALDRIKLNHMLYSYATKVESVTSAEFNDHDARAAIYSQFYTNTRRLVDVPTGSILQTRVLGVNTSVGTPGEKILYLTFDDGPNIIYHPLVLDILKEKNVKATFYLVGSNSKLYPSTTKRTIEEGHVIGDHSLTHAYLAKLLPNQIIDEIKTTQDILNGFLGKNKKITVFRPPYGGTNALVLKDATDLGLKQELWTVDPKDWSDPTTDELVNRVVSNTQNGSIVLLHSNHFSTVKALPIIIDKLREKGFQFRLQQ